jgi:hypothetical protein
VSYDTHKITSTNTDRLLTGIFNTDRSITDTLFMDTFNTIIDWYKGLLIYLKYL